MNIKSKYGQAVVEYALILSCVSMVSILTLHNIGIAVKNILQIVMLELSK